MHVSLTLTLVFPLVQFRTVHHLAKLVLLVVFSLGLAVHLPAEDVLATVSGLLPVSVLAVVVARHEDLLSRMEWLWRERLKGEEEGVDTMQGINKVLLENLLPAHVARHFITIIKVNSRPAPAFDHLAIQINIC